MVYLEGEEGVDVDRPELEPVGGRIVRVGRSSRTNRVVRVPAVPRRILGEYHLVLEFTLVKCFIKKILI